MGLFDFLRRAFTSTKDLENNKPSGKILNKRQKRDIIGLSDEEIEKLKKEAYEKADADWHRNLTEKAMKRSDEFSKIHSNKTKAININNISNSKKDYSPLTPYEILFLDYINGKSIKDPNIAGYWTHEYNLDYQAVIEKLFNNGYLQESDYKFNMTKCKLPELKGYLKDKGLNVTGKKEDLITRIINESPEEDSAAYFNNSHFECTDKAIEILADNQHIMYSHRHRNDIGISVRDADNFKKENPLLNHYQLFLEMLTKRLHEYEQSKSWGLYRNNILGMSIVYGDMKDHAKELEFLLEVCYRDLSGLMDSGSVSEKMSFLAPRVVARVVAIKKESALSEQLLWDLFIDTISKINLENSLYTAEHSYNLLMKEIRKLGCEM
jgi:hypothetical protein